MFVLLLFFFCVCMHHLIICIFHHVLSTNKIIIHIYVYIFGKMYFVGECVGRMSTKKTIVHFTVSTPDIRKLKIIKEKLPSGVWVSFKIAYVNILDLLRLKVKKEASPLWYNSMI